MTSGLGFLVAALHCEIEALQQLGRTSALVAAIGRLVHELQRERGISNVLIGSQGRRFAEQHATQITASQAAEAEVREAFDRLAAEAEARPANGARLFSRMAWVLPGLEALPGLRRRVAALALDTQQATAAYVKLVAGLLAVVFEAADGATDPEISRLLVAMFNFMQGKEFAGQERACGSAAFVSGRSDAARQQQWLHLIDSQERCFQLFAEFAGEALRERWLREDAGAGSAAQERLRRIGCAAAPGTKLDPDLSQAWFDCCTRRIDAMQAVEASLSEALRALCERRIDQARAELQGHQALLARIDPAAPASTTLFFDEPQPGDAVPEPAAIASGAGASTAAYGPQLERSILEMLQEQARRLQAMSDELETVRAALNERKLVERAKGLLMAHRRLSEQDAHKMLRQTAMTQNRRLVEVAESVLSMADLLPDPGARHGN